MTSVEDVTMPTGTSGEKTAELTIAQMMRQEIVDGALPFGARLRIDGLANRYGVSHMPIREALRELHGEGLITIERNRGARVQSLHRGFVEDIFDIRSAIEMMLARRAAERRSETHLTLLREAAAKIELLVETGDYAAVPEANRNFHGIINDAAGNPGALSIVDRHWLLMAALFRRYGADEGRFHSVIDDHRQLLRAIDRRDASSAATFMGAHIERAKYNLLERMGEPSPVPSSPPED